MITFKQFLVEGGKATEKYGTVRATRADMKAAIAFVAKTIGVSAATLKDRLLGSGRLTYNGVQPDSGDVDLAISTDEVQKDDAVSKMTAAVGHAPHVTGGSTYSFAVPTGEKRKVQVDLMFVPDVNWAKFSHHASEHSKHKSGVRNELLHSALKFTMQDGKDLRIKDDAGADIVRASRAYKLIDGVERIFKVAPPRKDGKGRVKSVEKASAEQVKTTLSDLGIKQSFSDKPDIIRDPDRFAELLFGRGTTGSQMMTVEQLIKLINARPDAEDILKDAVRGIKRLNFKVPDELKAYE